MGKLDQVAVDGHGRSTFEPKVASQHELSELTSLAAEINHGRRDR